jgi:Fe-S-cluster containining protein
VTDAELSALCQACGLCCDGSLFGRVDLAPDEVGPAKKNHLRVLSNGRAFEQPCTALAPRERTCGVYEARPAACRAFECRLHARHRREGGPLEPRLDAVRRVRELLATLEAAALPDTGELTRLLDEDFARA